MYTLIEIISGQILTLLESKSNALAFHEIKESIPDEPEMLIHISLHWLVRGGLISENAITNEFKIMEDGPVSVLSACHYA
jgi:hypothetical protein